MIKSPVLPSGSDLNIKFSSEILAMIANREALLFGEKTIRVSDISGLNELSLRNLKNLYKYSRYISDDEISEIMKTQDSLGGGLKIAEVIGRVRLVVDSYN